MEETFKILNRLVDDGIVDKYAIGGAVAAIFYIEPLNTHDLDVFFHVNSGANTLDILSPIYDYLQNLGYSAEGEALNIEGWPVQFLPVFNSLIDEAVNDAKEILFEKTPTRIMGAEHLVAIMVQTGRPKDHARIRDFLDQNAVDLDILHRLLDRHLLIEKWAQLRRSLNENIS